MSMYFIQYLIVNFLSNCSSMQLKALWPKWPRHSLGSVRVCIYGDEFRAPRVASPSSSDRRDIRAGSHQPYSLSSSNRHPAPAEERFLVPPTHQSVFVAIVQQ